jgi:cyanate lyase
MQRLKHILYSLSNTSTQKTPYIFNILRIEAIARKALRETKDLNIAARLLMQDSLFQEIQRKFGEENTIDLAFYLAQKAADKEEPIKNLNKFKLAQNRVIKLQNQI